MQPQHCPCAVLSPQCFMELLSRDRWHLMAQPVARVPGCVCALLGQLQAHVLAIPHPQAQKFIPVTGNLQGAKGPSEFLSRDKEKPFRAAATKCECEDGFGEGGGRKLRALTHPWGSALLRSGSGGCWVNGVLVVGSA